MTIDSAADKWVVMGVSGCGKSTLAQALAQRLSARLIEGDDHHLPTSRDKMRAGIALTDADREPWLDLLGAMLAADGGPVVLSCSALKRRYRDRLRAAVPTLRFVYLSISRASAERRVAQRSSHYFPAGLVASQFDALEPPTGEAGVVTVDADDDTGRQVDRVMAGLDGAGPTPIRRS
jgi:gluconokinase